MGALPIQSTTQKNNTQKLSELCKTTGGCAGADEATLHLPAVLQGACENEGTESRVGGQERTGPRGCVVVGWIFKIRFCIIVPGSLNLPIFLSLLSGRWGSRQCQGDQLGYVFPRLKSNAQFLREETESKGEETVSQETKMSLGTHYKYPG